MVNHIVQVGKGTSKFPSVDGLGRLTGVLKGDTKVGAAGSSGFAWLDLCCCVADLGEMVRDVSCRLLEMGSSIGMEGRGRRDCSGKEAKRPNFLWELTILVVEDGILVVYFDVDMRCG